jgi:hypothetical protein
MIDQASASSDLGPLGSGTFLSTGAVTRLPARMSNLSGISRFKRSGRRGATSGLDGGPMITSGA